MSMSSKRVLAGLITLVALLAGATLSTITAPPVAAQTEGGGVQAWALSPAGRGGSTASDRPNLTYSAAPGTTIDDAVVVANYGTTQLTVELYAADARNTEDGSFDLVPSGMPSTDVGTWVTFPQAAVTLAPGTAITIPIKITVPADAKPGDHIGGVLASVKARSNAPDGNDVVVDRRTGTRVYLRVEGPITPALAITNVSSGYDAEPNPLGGTEKVSFTIRNTGNVRIGGTYWVTVSGPLGIGRKSTEPVTFTDLVPGQELRITSQIDGVAATGLTNATVHLDPSSFSGDPTSVAKQTRSSLSLAIPVVIVGGFVILVLGAIVIASIRRRRRDEIRLTAAA